MDTKVCKFQLEDRVTSKKTGLPSVGTIKAIIDGEYFVRWFQREYPRWDSLYPDWKEKYVCCVLFDKPQKSLSFEEFYNNNPVYENKEEAMIIYKYIQIVHSSQYPEDDLEIL